MPVSTGTSNHRGRLRRLVSWSGAGLVAALVLWGAPIAVAAGESSGASQAQPAPAAEAVALLERMHAHLRQNADARFTTEFQITADVAGLGKRGKALFMTRQPNLFRVEVTIGNQLTHFISDGTTLTIYRPAQKRYAQLRAKDSIVGTMYKATGVLALQARVVDFIWTADYLVTLREDVRVLDKGIETVGGRPCRRMLVERMEDSWDAWIASEGAPLPCRLVSRRRDDPARTQQTTDFTWAPDAVTPAERFTFSPPAGAVEVSPADLE